MASSHLLKRLQLEIAMPGLGTPVLVKLKVVHILEKFTVIKFQGQTPTCHRSAKF